MLRKSRLPALTGMRFPAAAAVFLAHATQHMLFASPQANAEFTQLFGRAGQLGVGLFFVLSGFALTWAVRNTDTIGGFWRRGFFKIYPSHVLTFTAAFILLVTVADVVVHKEAVLLNLFLLQAWSPDFGIILSVNSVSWPLSAGAACYLAFPLLMLVVGRIRPQRLWAWAGAVVAAIFAVPFGSLLLSDGTLLPGMPVSADQFWFIAFFPPVRMLDFVFGMLLARIVLTGRRLPVGLGGAMALAVGAYAVAPLFWGELTLVAVMVVPLGLVVAAAAADATDNQRSWLGSPVMVWLGNVSFAFYLWHFMVLTYGHRLLGSTGGFSTPVAVAVLVLLFGVTLLLAWLTFTLFEQPVMQRFAQPRQRARCTPPPATAHVPTAR